MIKLVIQSGPLEGRVFVPPPGGEVSIGRAKECFVCLDSGKVSRKHAVLLPRGEGYAIRDAGSRNGTRVNGTKVEERALRSGDTIHVGEFQIAYLVEELDPWVGKVVAGHRILERLGTGGMGTVYRAHQIAMDRSVALKMLSAELGRNEVFVARFVDEARAMAKVSHPHVVQVHTVGQVPDAGAIRDPGTIRDADPHPTVFFLSMEHLEGGSLKDLLDREGPLPPRKAVSLILDATEALIWAEQRGIVHRDLKPGNLLLDASGRVKVGDFGLAADLRRSDSGRDEGQILGSPHFMAPEQALGRAVDHRADIYALGSTLYVALSGKNPFPGRGVKEVILKKVKGEPIPIAQVAPGVPPALQEVLAKAMARRPEDRHQSARDLRDALRRVLEALPSHGPAPHGPAPHGPAPHGPAPHGPAPRGPAPRGPAPRGPAPRPAAKAPLHPRHARGAAATRSRLRRSRVSGPLVLASIVGACVVGGLMVAAFIGRAPEGEREGSGESLVNPLPAAGKPTPFPGTPFPGTPFPGTPLPGTPLPGAPVAGPAAGDAPRTDATLGNAGATGAVRDPPKPDPPLPLPADLLAEIDLLVLEGRFEEARARLETGARTGAQGGAEASASFREEERRIAGAEALVEARSRALGHERAGDLEEARREMERVVESVPEPYRTEARKAVEAIARRAEGQP